MPTYTFRCTRCGTVEDFFHSISEYSAGVEHAHCERPMERFFCAPQCPLLNAMLNDRHYEGLTASDGTDISSRAKHRAYMREHNLTTVDDFTETWAREARARQARLDGVDPQRAHDIEAAVRRLEH